jgi:ABC-type multidrug transport system ATPase subunit
MCSPQVLATAPPCPAATAAAPDAPRPSVRIRGVDKTFRQRRSRIRVFTSLDLSLDLARVNLILGRNGCGKSTLLRLVAGLVTPDRGTVDLAAPPSPRGAPALLYAGASPGVLVGKLTLRENLAYFAALRGCAIDEARYARLLHRFQIIDRADDLVEGLSRGTQQKALLVRALACEARVVLLDEPTESLDDAAAAALVDEITDRTRAGTGFVIATHDRRFLQIEGSCRFVSTHAGGFVRDTGGAHD